MYFWHRFMCWLGYHSWRRIPGMGLMEECEHCGIDDDIDLPN